MALLSDASPDNVEKYFKTNFITQSKQKNCLTASMKEHGNYQVSCSSFSVDFMEITTISQSSFSTRADMLDLFIATAATRVPWTDWHASAISKNEMFEYEFKENLPLVMTHKPCSYRMNLADINFNLASAFYTSDNIMECWWITNKSMHNL